MTQDPGAELEITDYGLLDKSNPRSLVNIVPSEVRAAILRIPKELLLMEEKALRRKVKPSDTLNYLRLNFWLEYNRAQERQCRMMMSNVLRGACSKEWFYDGVVSSDDKMAWILTPPADYTVVQVDIFQTSLEKLRQCLRVRPYNLTVTEETDKDGNKTVTRKQVPNVAAMREIREIVRMLSDRVQGSVVQHLAIKAQSHNVNEERSLPGGPQTYDADSLDRLNRTLEQVNQALLLPEAGAEITEDIIEGEMDAEGS